VTTTDGSAILSSAARRGSRGRRRWAKRARFACSSSTTIRSWSAVCVRPCSRRRPLDASPDTDLVLLDLTMPGVRGFSGLLFLRSQRPATPIIVVSGNEERAVIRHCMEFGAAGFIPKTNSLDTMRAAIAQVLDGGRWTPPDFDPSSAPNGQSSAMARRLASLTPQQIRVLMMLSQGLLNKQIAYELSVSEATVKAHVSAIFQKLGVESRTQAVILATKIEAAQELSIAQ
jgi:DNA-binding NarL/FixJ family response regulator